MTLTTRLSVFFLSMLAVVLVGFSIALYLLASSYLIRQVTERLENVLNTISSAIEAEPNGVEWEPANRNLNLDFAMPGERVVWLVADDQGRIVDQAKGANAEEFLAETSLSLRLSAPPSGSSQRNGSSWEVGQRWIHAENRKADQAGNSQSEPNIDNRKYAALSVTAGVSLAPIRATLRQLAGSLTRLSLGIWLISFVAGRFVCRRALLPLSRMAVAAGEIDADDLSQRLPAVSSRDEINNLSRAFNGLLDRLQIAFERQRRFTGDASHQLRTPLTAILGQIEVALRRERSAEEYRQILAMVQPRAGHLSRVVESLLFLARADSDARRPDSAPLDLSIWLPQHLQTWSEHARARDMSIESTSCETCSIDAQPALLGELLNILLDNACKYSQPGTPITIRLQRSADAVFVKVEDQGCGIDESDLANLFVPFYRSADARRRGIEGVGLGLSIAQRLAGIFGGELTVSSRPRQGSCFIIRFASALSNHADAQGLSSDSM